MRHSLVLRPHRRLATFVVVRMLLAVGEITTVGTRTLASAGPADTVVVRYTQTLGELAGSVRGPSLIVHDDGTVEAHYPAFMHRAGTYRGRLEPAALDALVGRLIDHGVLDFDPDRVRVARADAERRGASAARAAGREPTYFVATDPSVTSITMRVEGIERTTIWRGLRSDAERFPGIPALQGLRAAERELHAIMERGDLRPVE